jgi:hypothetical protein
LNAAIIGDALSISLLKMDVWTKRLHLNVVEEVLKFEVKLIKPSPHINDKSLRAVRLA